MAQFSINGTVETIAREDIDPESDNAVIKAKVTAVNTPVRQGIQNGRVAALKGRFDGLAERENKDEETAEKLLQTYNTRFSQERE